jgi:hypothetical protein
MTAIAAGTAGLLLWVATQVGQQTTARFWAAMGIVASAGLVVALAQAIGGWTRGLRLRLSPGTFFIGFLPTLVVAGWVLLATQPIGAWPAARLSSWSASLGVGDVVHDLGLWHGVLAFGLGLVLGLSLHTVPVVVEAVVADDVGASEPPVDRWAADEPVAAESEDDAAAEAQTVVAGPREEA